MKEKYKGIETLMNSMQLSVFDERPDCCEALKLKDQWIMSYNDIEHDEYNNFMKQLQFNPIEETFVKYLRHHFPYDRNQTTTSSTIAENIITSSQPESKNWLRSVLGSVMKRVTRSPMPK